MLILRELLVLAQGQELKLALGLWGWLLWTGVGALLGGRRGRPEFSGALLGGLLTLMGLLLPATVLAIRVVPSWAGLAGGQSLPLGTGLVLFLSLLAPFCLISGYFFPCACQTLANSGPGGTGRVYSLETLGAALGVILLQLFLLGRYGGLALSLATGLLLALSPWVLDRHQGLKRRGVQLTVALLLVSGLYWVTPLEQFARSRQWPGRQVIATADSPYGFLSVSREDGQVSFFANNLWQFTYPDPFTAEHRVQLGLLAHPDPRRVLLLGGGVGLVPEILKTGSVSRLDYVELDPRLVDLAQGLLPGAGAWLRDPRVRLSLRDARHFVAGSPERYDVILMALPEPRSAQLNRFYTREFFRLVSGKLAPGGVFNFSLAGSETSLHPWRAAYLALVYHTLGQVFPEVLALPGERVQFFGATASGVLAADPELLVARLKNRRLPLRYVREYYLRDDLAPAKVAYLRQVLDRQPAELNTDLTPRCYFYDLALGGIQEDLPIGRVLLALKHLPAYLLWAALGLATLILTAALRGRPGPLCLYQVTVMGLGTMALEILVLILYQIHLGSLYRQLGLLIAVFMAGMGGGAVVGGFLVGGGEDRRDRGQALRRWLAGLQIMLGLVALSLALFLTRSPFAALPVPEYLIQGGFALILAVAGFGGGGIFALSAGLWFRERGESGAKGGLLYAVDLLGSTLGTLGFSFFIVPVWGIWPALILVAAIHGGAALMLLTRRSAN
ncbi:MAG: hypothetical protein NTY36_07985 [Deltaproteobacteria bacterium]|nr:hypothetical protein [Deltaproteobacteria bacterium]